MVIGFSVDSGQSQAIGVAVGGYLDLLDSCPLATPLSITPNQGELVKISKEGEIDVKDGMLAACRRG